MPRFHRAVLSATSRAAMLAVALGVAQIASASERAIVFDIPAQPLDQALGVYAAKTRVQLFFDAAITAGMRSVPLNGWYTPEAALTQLLADSGLASRAISDLGFTLVPQPAVRPAGGGASTLVRRFGDYSAAVQGAARTALCRQRETIPGSYRVLVRLWVDRADTVTRTELVTSTGDHRRDAAVSSAFTDLVIGAPPPAELPQPVTLLVAAGEAASSYCSESRLVRRADNGRAGR